VGQNLFLYECRAMPPIATVQHHTAKTSQRRADAPGQPFSSLRQTRVAAPWRKANCSTIASLPLVVEVATTDGQEAIPFRRAV